MRRPASLARHARRFTSAGLFTLVGCTAMVNSQLDGLPLEHQLEHGDAGADAANTASHSDGATSSPDGGGNDVSSNDASVSSSNDGATPAVGNDASTPPPAGAVAVELCVGVLHACGLMPSGTVTCWGDTDDDDGQTTLQSANPGVHFVNITCGDYHTCGVATDGSVLCVGRNRDGQREAPSATDHHDYVQVAAGDVQTCARKHDGTVDCWGGSGAITWTQPPGDAFDSISAGAGYACGIRSLDGSLLCWGDDSRSQTRPPTDLKHALSLEVGDGEGCALDQSGAAHCWGAAAGSIPVLTSVLSISVGGDANHDRGCALLTNGSATCWVDDQVSMLPGPFRAVSVGGEATCFLPQQGNLSCKSGGGNPSLPDFIVTRVPQPYPPPGETLP